MGKCYELVKKFKRKYPFTVCFRLDKHSKILEKHLNPDEEIFYAFCAQKNSNPFDFTNTYVIALTNKRILLATKRILWGYFLLTITPDMFNDMTVKKNLIWGSVILDTIKEVVTLSDIDPRALPEVETVISEYMMKEKKKYPIREKEREKGTV